MNRRNRSTMPRNNKNINSRRPLARRQNGFVQNGAGVSHQDNVPQVRKFQIFETIKFENAGSDYAVGLRNVNVYGNQSPLSGLLSSYQLIYEQYRISRVRVRAQVGKNYTNDDRLKTLLGARVDVDKQLVGATVSNVQSVNCAENTVIKTFTERGNVLVADFRPQNRLLVSNISTPVLPNPLQFYPISDAAFHVWKGATVTAMIPDITLLPDQMNITLIIEVDVVFRGRVTDPTSFTGTIINQHPLPSPIPPIADNNDEISKGAE